MSRTLNPGDTCFFYIYKNAYKFAYHLTLVVNIDTDRECSIGFYPTNGILRGLLHNQESCLRVPDPIFICHNTFLLKDSKNEPIRANLTEYQASFLNTMLSGACQQQYFPCSHEKIHLLFPYSVLSYNCVDFIAELFPDIIKDNFSKINKLRKFSYIFLIVTTAAFVTRRVYAHISRRHR